MLGNGIALSHTILVIRPPHCASVWLEGWGLWGVV